MKDSYNKIFKASLKLFADKGYDSITIRDIIKKAGVNISLVSYYFKGKEQLYVELIHYVIDTFRKYVNKYCKILKYVYYFDEEGEENRKKIFGTKTNEKEFNECKVFFQQEIKDKNSKIDIFTNNMLDCRKLNTNELKRLFLCFFRLFTREFFINRNPEISSIIIKETVNPSVGYSMMYKDAIYPFHILMSKLLSKIISVKQNDIRVLLLLQSFMGQMSVFMLNRKFNCNVLGVTKYSAKIIDTIVNMTSRNIELILENI